MIWCWLCVVSTLLLFVSCQNDAGAGQTKHVLLMWSTTPDDPAYEAWTSDIRREFHRQHINVSIDCYYAQIGEDSVNIAFRNFRNTIDSLRKENLQPDVVLVCGDYLCDMLVSRTDMLPDSVPFIFYGLNTPPSVLQQKQPVSSLHPCVYIVDELDVEKNLKFADYIANLHPQSDSLVSWMSDQPRHRFCSLLDPESYAVDRYRFDQIDNVLNKLDTARFYNNFHNDVEEDTLVGVASTGRIVYSCRSLRQPTFNCPNPLKHQIPAKWSFYPQMSPNIFMQVKHDYVSRSCTEGPNFGLYFTMVAEDYLINENCIGGYIAPADMQIRDAVTVAKRLFDGETPQQIGTLKHQHQYCINWDVLRGKGLTLDQLPEYIHKYNVSYKDRNPITFRNYLILSAILLCLLLICAMYYTRKVVKRSRISAQQYKRLALQAIRNQRLLEYTLRATGSVSWSDQEDEYTLLNRLEVNDFYKEKLIAFLHETKDGRYNMQLQAGVDGQPVHWYELLMNVTHEHGELTRRGMLVMIDAQKEQESRNIEVHRMTLNTQMREGFVASMGHEIRTPLNAIVGFAQVLAMPGMELSPEEIQEYAKTIDSNVAVLKKMINDLLLVTLMSNSNISAQCAEYSTISLMQTSNWPDAMDYLQRRGNQLKMESSYGGMSVNVDPKLFHAVMENLLINASKFSDEGSTIGVGWEMCNTDGAEGVQIWVRDQGVGISPEQQEMIFNRFYKVDSFVPGCGLGLFICKTYVELMGGTISVESRQGEGSTFSIRFKR